MTSPALQTSYHPPAVRAPAPVGGEGSTEPLPLSFISLCQPYGGRAKCCTEPADLVPAPWHPSREGPGSTLSQHLIRCLAELWISELGQRPAQAGRASPGALPRVHVCAGRSQAVHSQIASSVLAQWAHCACEKRETGNREGEHLRGTCDDLIGAQSS